MKTASGSLITFLGGMTNAHVADLYTFTLLSGAVVRLTSYQNDLVVSGNTYLSSGPYIRRSKISQGVGLNVSTMEIKIDAAITHLVGSIPFLQACRIGVFDGATVTLNRLVMATPGDTSLGVVNMFTGRVSTISIGRISATMTCASDLSLLNMQLPRNLFQAGCIFSLFDTGCTLNKASFATSKIVSTVTNQLDITATVAISQADGYFNQGTITFTSGQNNGLSGTIRFHASGHIYLAVPFIYPVAPGDAFTIYPGCDKTQSTCSTKFSNLIHFGGTPNVPRAETAI